MPTLSTSAAVAAAATLIALLVAHVYWAFGGAWPASSHAELPRYVVGSPPGVAMPGPIECLVVAALLGVAAFLVLSGSAVIRTPFPLTWLRGGTWLVALAFFGRGVYGFTDHLFRPFIIGSPYEHLNRVVFSPLCLVLALVVAVALTTDPA